MAAMEKMPQYEFEHIYIDNASTDKTVAILRRLAQEDKTIRVIVNARNFGHIRSPYYALLQAKGDAVICLASDLQDPPELIYDFTKRWEEGFKVVMGVKTKSEESPLMFALRKLYYKTLQRLSDTKLIENFTGYGLYDQQVIDILREMDDPYPYFRGMIAEIGFPAAKIEFIQPTRKHGITKNNFYTLFDMAMLGMTNYSKVPLRLATMFGFVVAVLSALVGLFYFIYKLFNWQNFTVGSAPVVVGLFFFGAVQLFFLGVLGEYIGAIYTQVLHRPL
ncbi:MAG TPA: glycosyltransferase family 2 protein, partial [Desulfosporosinus sp.]|nr:glycosyltransferase family 2 protein [Desulfosporosinus sp.]